MYLEPDQSGACNLDYRPIDKTNLKLSALSFGTMRFADDDSAAEAVKKAIDCGINYFDVAPAYCGKTSERRLGLGLKGAKRSKLIVTAKSSPGDGGEGVGEVHRPDIGFGINTADQARRQIERSMQIIGVDHLNVYHLWAIHHDRIFDEAMKSGGFLEGVKKAQGAGLIDYIGLTTHMPADNIIGYLQRFDFDMITIPFHLRDTSRAAAVQYCADHGIGVIAMNPLAGGALAKPAQSLQAIASSILSQSSTLSLSKGAAMTEAALRFLLGYPGVTSALVGFTYASQVEEDVAHAAKGGLSAEAMDALHSRVTELYANVQHFCSGCGYCGECPEGVLIPKVLEVYSNLLVPSTADSAMDELVEHALQRRPGSRSVTLRRLRRVRVQVSEQAPGLQSDDGSEGEVAEVDWGHGLPETPPDITNPGRSTNRRQSAKISQRGVCQGSSAGTAAPLVGGIFKKISVVRQAVYKQPVDLLLCGAGCQGVAACKGVFENGASMPGSCQPSCGCAVLQ